MTCTWPTASTTASSNATTAAACCASSAAAGPASSTGRWSCPRSIARRASACSATCSTSPTPATTPCAGSSCAAATSIRSEEHTSELQSLMRISYAVFCLKKHNNNHTQHMHKYASKKIDKLNVTGTQYYNI